MLRALRYIVVLMAFQMTAPACTAGETSQGTRIEITESGIRSVRNSGPGSWSDTERWVAEESFRIGALEGDGPDVFGRVWSIVPWGGRLAVLDHLAQEVRLFDQTGRHVLTFGRSGEGPGEFGFADGLATDDRGQLWVADTRARTLMRFDSTGGFLSEIPYMAGTAGAASGLLRVGDRILDWVYDNPDRDRDAGLIGSRIRYRPIALDTTAQVADTFPGVVASFEMEAETRVPLTASLSVAPSAIPGEFWLADSVGYRLVRRRLDGDTALIVSLDDAQIAVVPDRVADSLAGGNAVVRNAMPERYPAIHHLLTDGVGHLWVFPRVEGADPGAVIDVFDEGSGGYLGRVRLPFPISSIPAARAGEGVLYTGHRGVLDVDAVVRIDLRAGG